MGVGVLGNPALAEFAPAYGAVPPFDPAVAGAFPGGNPLGFYMYDPTTGAPFHYPPYMMPPGDSRAGFPVMPHIIPPFAAAPAPAVGPALAGVEPPAGTNGTSQPLPPGGADVGGAGPGGKRADAAMSPADSADKKILDAVTAEVSRVSVSGENGN